MCRTCTLGFVQKMEKASFTPETVGELIVTVRGLIETAKRAKERRSSLTEYVVAVG